MLPIGTYTSRHTSEEDRRRALDPIVSIMRGKYDLVQQRDEEEDRAMRCAIAELRSKNRY